MWKGFVKKFWVILLAVALATALVSDMAYAKGKGKKGGHRGRKPKVEAVESTM